MTSKYLYVESCGESKQSKASEIRVSASGEPARGGAAPARAAQLASHGDRQRGAGRPAGALRTSLIQ
jgi:hypothetical protein